MFPARVRVDSSSNSSSNASYKVALLRQCLGGHILASTDRHPERDERRSPSISLIVARITSFRWDEILRVGDSSEARHAGNVPRSRSTLFYHWSKSRRNRARIWKGIPIGMRTPAETTCRPSTTTS
ncbi:MAG TPA: hypothetical protein DCQ98_12125 [Planctomycetaceae bacterium]|nr:hypothetical protein [Planctomycetaceae bacterium]